MRKFEFFNTIRPEQTAGIDFERPFRIRRLRVQFLRNYSGTASPDPPSSAGKSFIFGSPSFIGSTVLE